MLAAQSCYRGRRGAWPPAGDRSRRGRLPEPSLPPPSRVPPLFHHSCHCYYVIFLTRPSRLREQHYPPLPPPPLPHPDGLVRDACSQGGLSCSRAATTPPHPAQRLCGTNKKGFSGGILPEYSPHPPTHTHTHLRVPAGGRGPLVPPPLYTRVVRVAGSSAALSTLLPPPPPHLSPAETTAFLIDHNGKWQNRWGTREVCTGKFSPSFQSRSRGLVAPPVTIRGARSCLRESDSRRGGSNPPTLNVSMEENRWKV